MSRPTWKPTSPTQITIASLAMEPNAQWPPPPRLTQQLQISTSAWAILSALRAVKMTTLSLLTSSPWNHHWPSSRPDLQQKQPHETTYSHSSKVMTPCPLLEMFQEKSSIRRNHPSDMATCRHPHSILCCVTFIAAKGSSAERETTSRA